ncbi:protoporphyrin IX magnesium-chelatase [Roseivivax lentus]|uniref:Protoporphyrin IX magnesium-chelatase n=1 Tax=Roseivivax lentus TaxID=633194 RepID=A0A1N7JNI4_9RHOB|nr:magnesium chelatase subunit D [Roseivivax lentus]SIS50898.1 protoporphyrin IX magnesium-chelatase [Roseivivax lentus]
MKQSRPETWVAGHLALLLIAVDPAGLGGLHLRARACPVRDAFLNSAPDALLPMVRIAPTLDDDAVFGGTDIAESLRHGRLVRKQGLISRAGTLLLTMAERLRPGRAARLSQHLDTAESGPMILLDEGIDDEAAPRVLTERLAFMIDLDGVRAFELSELALSPEDVADARAHLDRVTIPDAAIAALTVAAARLGIGSMRAPVLALAAARANAALHRRNTVTEEDLNLAVELVFAHRATQLPEDAGPPSPDTEPPDTEPDTETEPEGKDQSFDIPDELLVDAVRAVLPDGALFALSDAAKSRAPAQGTGAGRRRRSNRRGRPLPAKPGKPGSDARLDLFATLRAAAPWQQMRRAAQPDRTGLILKSSDFRVKVYEERSDRLIIFVVDASGSAAVTRLAEAKGAVETVLADAYASRDHVALIAFRGDGAEALLPPTRSLVQAKRALGALPGGGGTPLAAGLRAAADMARRAQGQGMSPALALLTDGRANIGLTAPGREAAQADAERYAALIAAMRLPALVLDTNRRPKDDLSALAGIMGATYLPLPRADAQAISRSVHDALRK